MGTGRIYDVFLYLVFGLISDIHVRPDIQPAIRYLSRYPVSQTSNVGMERLCLSLYPVSGWISDIRVRPVIHSDIRYLTGYLARNPVSDQILVQISSIVNIDRISDIRFFYILYPVGYLARYLVSDLTSRPDIRQI